MAGITLHLTGDELGFESALERVMAAMDDNTPLMSAIGGHLTESAQTRIDHTNIGPDGIQWTMSRRVQNKGGKTLLKSHVLRNSIHFEAGKDFVEVGSDVIYSAVHQLGAAVGAFGRWEHFGSDGEKHSKPLPFGDIPARPYLGVSRDDQSEIASLVQLYLTEITGNH